MALLSRAGGIEEWEAAAIANLPRREVILRRDVAIPLDGDVIFVLLEGWACRQKMSRDGVRQICAIHLDGDAPDLDRLFLAASDREFRTLSSCRISLIPALALRDMAQKSRTLANAISRCIAVAGVISEEWIVNIGRRRAINRVAHLICELVSRIDAVKGAEQPVYSFPLTQTDLGDATGLSTVHVNRVLQELRAKAMLELGSSRLVVPDRLRLAEIADFDPCYLHLKKSI